MSKELFLAFLKPTGGGLSHVLHGITAARELTVGQVFRPSLKDAAAHHVRLGVGLCQNVEWDAK